MKKISFDIVALIVGLLFFFVYLMIFEESLFRFPIILSTVYFFICTICFALVLENFESTIEKRIPAVFFRLIYLGLYFLSPLYFVYILTGGSDEKKE